MGRITKKESDYRMIDRMSYSGLSQFIKNKKKFKDKYIDKIEVEDLKSDEVRRGSVVDTLLTDTDNFDNLYQVAIANKPTGQLLTFTEFLIDLHLQDPNRDALELFKEAYSLLEQSNGGKVRNKFETFVTDFNDKAVDYYEETLLSKDKTLITPDDYALCKKIAQSIRESDTTKEEFLKCNTFKEVILFDYRGIPMKCEVDLSYRDDKKKIIEPKDLKVTSFVESFIWDNFLKFNYYIQSSLYRYALQQKYPDYDVRPFTFIVGCQNAYNRPLIYTTSDKWHKKGFDGFTVGKVKYKGIDQIIDEIQLTVDNNLWDISVDNYNNNGVIQIPEFDD